MKIYLVTGGAGFIGSNFIRYILNNYEDITVINVDKLTYAGNLENIKDVEGNPDYAFIHGDICDKACIKEIFDKYDIDYVVNFAAESHVDRSIEEPEIFVKTNVLGTANLLSTAKRYWQAECGYRSGKKFLQVSTDEVYGSLDEVGYFTETTPLDPHSPYSSSKAGADLLVKAYYDTYGMPANITRCSNNYGSYQFPEKLIPLIINNCLNKKTIPVYGDGMNIRDWIYVEDHCRAIDMVIRDGRPGEIYNVGGHNEKTNLYIVRSIINYINKHVDNTVTEDLIVYVKDRKGHDRRYAIDPSKIEDELGWHPETSFEEGINKTISWYMNNQAWLRKVTSGEYQSYYHKTYEG